MICWAIQCITNFNHHWSSKTSIIVITCTSELLGYPGCIVTWEGGGYGVWTFCKQQNKFMLQLELNYIVLNSNPHSHRTAKKNGSRHKKKTLHHKMKEASISSSGTRQYLFVYIQIISTKRILVLKKYLLLFSLKSYKMCVCTHCGPIFMFTTTVLQTKFFIKRNTAITSHDV